MFPRLLEIHYQAIRNVDANMPFLAQDSDLLIAKKIAQLTTEACSILATVINRGHVK